MTFRRAYGARRSPRFDLLPDLSRKCGPDIDRSECRASRSRTGVAAGPPERDAWGEADMSLVRREMPTPSDQSEEAAMVKMRIVVGVDGSAGSAAAVRWAATAARLRDAELRVLTAYHRDRPG